VIGGDFNEFPEGRAIGALARRFADVFAGAAPTFPSKAPAARIDYVFLSRDVEVRSARVPLDEEISRAVGPPPGRRGDLPPPLTGAESVQDPGRPSLRRDLRFAHPEAELPDVVRLVPGERDQALLPVGGLEPRAVFSRGYFHRYGNPSAEGLRGIEISTRYRVFGEVARARRELRPGPAAERPAAAVGDHLDLDVVLSDPRNPSSIRARSSFSGTAMRGLIRRITEAECTSAFRRNVEGGSGDQRVPNS
jgi:hypothetical protein